MSAWIVPKIHIDAMVATALQAGRPGDEFRYWHEQQIESHRVRLTDADEVGRMLWNENLRSIHYRYPDTLENDTDYPGPIDFRAIDVATYTFPSAMSFRPIDPAKMFTPIACYEYQSCEHPEWKTSQAKAFCDELRRALIGRLGDTGPWGIDDIEQVAKQAVTNR